MDAFLLWAQSNATGAVVAVSSTNFTAANSNGRSESSTEGITPPQYSINEYLHANTFTVFIRRTIVIKDATAVAHRLTINGHYEHVLVLARVC